MSFKHYYQNDKFISFKISFLYLAIFSLFNSNGYTLQSRSINFPFEEASTIPDTLIESPILIWVYMEYSG